MTLPTGLQRYRWASILLGPFARLWLWQRALRGKEEFARLGERFGRSKNKRPDGKLVWLHAASVGESGVAMALIEALRARDRSLSFLLSTGTRTSADLAARRAGPETTHVYAPIDTPGAVKRFLRHWRPDLGIFVESEVWPNLILEAQASGAPLALVNARMSPATLARWRTWRPSGERLMRAFDLALAADTRTADALSSLRGEAMSSHGNLKLAAASQPPAAEARESLNAMLAGRPVWLAASTHPGEDEIVLAAHARVREQVPDALLIIAPRHPERGSAVSALAGRAPRRSKGEAIREATVYVADTLGEMALLYDAAPVALICGSLKPELKGHNPVEPAALGSAILTGPYVESFQDLFDALLAANGAVETANAEMIAAQVIEYWRDEPGRSAAVKAARGVVGGGTSALGETATRLLALMAPARESMADARA